jgi:hypothetical protein
MSTENTNTETPPPPPPKLEDILKANPALVDEFENRITGRIAQAEKAWKKANGGNGTSDAERQELETLRKDREERERKKLEEQGQYKAALEAQAQSLREQHENEKKPLVERTDTLSKLLREERVTSRLTSAAANGNAYNAEQVVALNQRFVVLDDEFQPTVVDAEGKPRFINGVPMTPAQLVDEFLKANPHMVKAPAGSNGGGAPGGANKGGGDASPLQAKEAELTAAREAYQRSGSAVDLSRVGKLDREIKALKQKAA